VPFTIIGVAPSTGFDFPSSATQFWTPLRINPTSWQFGRAPRWLSGVGRLRRGMGVPDAQAAVDVVVGRLAEAYPETNEGRAVRIRTLQDAVVGPSKPLLTMLVGTVAFVLLMGCVSVANLLLARGGERRREFAVRMALGASKRRLAGQVLAEGLVLTVAAGGAGMLIAHWGVGLLLRVSGGAIPRQSEIGIDARVLGFTLLIALGTGLFFALAPAARAARIESTSGMQDVKGGDTPVLGLRNALVMTQTALSVVLLIGAALLLQSLARLSRVDTGYDPSGAVSFTVSPPVARYPTAEHVKGFYRDLLERIGGLPEVTVASVGDRVPLAGGSWFDSFRIEGSASSAQDPAARIRVIAPDYFQALGVPVQRGRAFSERDDLAGPSVAMLNASAVRQYFDGGDPVGRRIEFFGEVWQVVGVVGDVRHAGPGMPARPALYLPWPQSERIEAFWRQGRVVVRTAGDPNAVVPLLRQVVRDVDPAIALGGLGTLQSTLSASLSPPRFRAALIGLFAVLALILSVVGIYSVIAYTVSRRTRELGIRIALGSRVQSVEWLVVRRGLALAVGAVFVGTAVALGMTRFLSSFLFEVTATDPWTFVGVPTLLLGVAVAASYLPARRAGRIDPLTALKSD
jgi:putative ABC transport system permease protein